MKSLHAGALRAFVLSVAALATACGGPTATGNEDPVPTTLTLSVSAVDLTFIGETRRVSATVLDQSGAPLQGAVVWSSLDESVATVTPTGIVRAMANGTTSVEAAAGALSESVTVTVAQEAASVSVSSGDDQSGLAGTELSEPLVAVVRDRGGAPVEGVEVTFAPGANSGSVSPTSDVSGADGTASTRWTLDAMFGPQTVVAAIDASDVEFSAFGGSDTPTPDLFLPDAVQVERPDPTSLDSVTVRATVRNQGDGAAGAFRVELRIDGVQAGSSDVAALAVSGEAEVPFDIAPLDVGTRSIEVVVDADDAVLELNELNNAGQKDLPVVLQQVVAAGTSVAGLSADPDDDLLFRVDVEGGPTNLVVALSGGTGDVDLWIEGGERPGARTGYDDCISDGPTMEERCQLPGSSGTFHVLVHAPNNSVGPAGFSNSTLTVTVGEPVEGFDLEMEFVNNGTPSQDQAFRDAAATWSGIIVGDVPDFDLDGGQIQAGACIDGQPLTTGVIDDVVIYIAIRPIDGPFGTLAQAGPCAIRSGSALPFVGVMEFDEDDLERLETDGDMGAVVLHEMGHVLGIGTIWERRDLLRFPSTEGSGDDCTVADPTAETHFRGALARDAFDAAGGSTYVAPKVPVANGELGAGCGSADGHWRESVLDTELMTPFIDGGVPNPMSAITVQSLADLGYFVDPLQADAYTLPGAPLQAPAVAPSADTRLVDLGDDLYRGPVLVMEQGGRVVEVLRR